MEEVKVRELWERHRERVVDVRRHIHSYPEKARQEERTAATVEEVLAACRPVELKRMVGTGVTALLKGEGEGSGRVMAIRADMDALAVAEKTGLPFTSVRPGFMHACGHDAHMAMALGAALILADMRKEWAGQVRLIFQPAEEEIGGAQPMIEAGVLDDPPVGAIVALHLWPDLPLGRVGLVDGPMMASNDRFRIQVKGESTHAAMPEKGVDTILVASGIVYGLQHLVSRETSAQESAVISFGIFRAGESFNVIPATAELEGSLRTLNPELRQRLKRRIREMAGGLARVYGARATIDYVMEYPVTMNDPGFNRVVAATAEKVLGANAPIWLSRPPMVSEDFSYFLERVPGAMVLLGCGDPNGGKAYPLHHECFQFDEKVLEYGTKLLVHTTMDYLNGIS